MLHWPFAWFFREEDPLCLCGSCLLSVIVTFGANLPRLSFLGYKVKTAQVCCLSDKNLESEGAWVAGWQWTMSCSGL